MFLFFGEVDFPKCQKHLEQEMRDRNAFKLHYNFCIRLSSLDGMVSRVRNGASQIKGLSLYLPDLNSPLNMHIHG